VGDLTFANSKGDFGIEAGLGAHDSNIGVGVEAVKDPTSGDLQNIVRNDRLLIALGNIWLTSASQAKNSESRHGM